MVDAGPEKARFPSGKRPQPRAGAHAADLLAERVSALRNELRQEAPEGLAERTGAVFEAAGDGGVFFLHLWQHPVVVTYPQFSACHAQDNTPLGATEQALIAYYFYFSDGTPAAHTWVSFTALPDGLFYAPAFDGYTGRPLVQTFGNDRQAFVRAAYACGGQKKLFADAAFSFQALPHLPLLVACWLGDEDFAPSYRVLFDANASHHLSTDACAVVGSMLARRLIHNREALP